MELFAKALTEVLRDSATRRQLLEAKRTVTFASVWKHIGIMADMKVKRPHSFACQRQVFDTVAKNWGTK